MTNRGLMNNLQPSTRSGYDSAIKHYESFLGKTIEELIREADYEQSIQIPLQKRHLKKHLTDFRTYLLRSDLSKRSAKQYYSKIKSFYRLNEIEIPDILPVRYEVENSIAYHDLPTREDIKNAVEMSDSLMQAVILFMSSSGCARAETLSLTVGDFISAAGKYNENSDISDVLKELSGKRIVPTFHLKRIKTQKYYYTYSTPEACEHIVNYLKTRSNLSYNDKLFDINMSSLTYRFREINDENNWGFKGNSRFFTTHALRRFHASNIGLPPEDIDELQGRGKSKIHDAYIKTNPEKLKEKYIANMHNVEIFTGQKKADPVDEEFNITINIFINNNQISL